MSEISDATKSQGWPDSALNCRAQSHPLTNQSAAMLFLPLIQNYVPIHGNASGSDIAMAWQLAVPLSESPLVYLPSRSK